MNMSRLPDDEQIEREWAAQEQALEHERLGIGKADDEAGVRRYRLLARALRQAPVDTLPADFAHRVAVRAAAIAPVGTDVNPGFERGLVQLAIAAFGLATGAVVVTYGADWLPALLETVRLGRFLDERWLLALLGCIGVTFAVQRAGPRRNR